MEKIGGRIVEAGLVAVGAGLEAAAQALLRRNESIALQSELLDLVQLGKDGRVTVQDIKINDQIGFALISLACVHLKRDQCSKFASHLPAAASQAILLLGPEGTEAYHQLIAKALAYYFEAKLLILNVTDSKINDINAGILFIPTNFNQLFLYQCRHKHHWRPSAKPYRFQAGVLFSLILVLVLDVRKFPYFILFSKEKRKPTKHQRPLHI